MHANEFLGWARNSFVYFCGVFCIVHILQSAAIILYVMYNMVDWLAGWLADWMNEEK